MGANATGGRYRAGYETLVRLYPRPFHERFGEGMAQTFEDLCRERRDAGRGVFGLAVWVYFETLQGIARENMTQMTDMGKTILRVALAALGLLMVPLVASRVVEGWHWDARAFVFVYVLFFATGMAYALIARKMGAWAYKAGVAVALVTGFAMGWTNMVHMSEAENPVYLVYFGVLVMGAVGAWLVQLEARGLARALFAMAATLTLMEVTAVLVSVGKPGGPERGIVIGHVVFAALFAVSGLLFRRASLAEAK